MSSGKPASLLWLALYFPRLSLEVFAAGLPREQPLAVSEGESLYACNGSARRLGIRPGQHPGEARALSRELLIQPRRRDLEQQALQSLALRGREFTSQLSLYGDNALVLELAGSLSLFGDLETLVRRITDDCQEQGHHCRHALTPSPAAALLLARACRPLIITERTELPRALAPLPVELCAQGPALRSLGMERLGQCLRLPAAELGRRFGEDFVHWLEELQARRPMPLTRWQAPEQFQHRLPLPAETDHHEALGFAFHRLLQELGSFLRLRVKGVELLTAQMFHRKHSVTQFTLSLLEPEQNPRYIMELLQQRLHSLNLPAPVHEVSLRSEVLSPLPSRPASLFADSTPLDWSRFAARLQSRLGSDAIWQLALGNDHRPEHRQRLLPVTATAHPDALPIPASHPLWLLEPPRRLACDNNRPVHNGSLTIISGIERVESGWWEDGAAVRDYYMARTLRNELLWIYQERHSGHWYLHGIFS